MKSVAGCDRTNSASDDEFQRHPQLAATHQSVIKYKLNIKYEYKITH